MCELAKIGRSEIPIATVVSPGLTTMVESPTAPIISSADFIRASPPVIIDHNLSAEYESLQSEFHDVRRYQTHQFQ